MRVKLLLPAVAAALLGQTACVINLDDSWRFTRDFHYSYTMAPGGKLSVENYNGSVEVTAWDQDTVDISGTKYAHSQSAADALRIETENTPHSVSVRVVRPSEFWGRMGARFVIKVPRHTELERIVSSNGSIRIMDADGPARLRSSNGSIRVQDFRGGVDAETSNGAVDLDNVAGEAVVRTSNGRIRAEGIEKTARLATSNGSVELTLPGRFDDVRIETSNGSITVRAPELVNARVSARTSNASIASDFEVKTRGDIGKHRLEGEIGSGGPLIELTTSNGRIRLVRM